MKAAGLFCLASNRLAGSAVHRAALTSRDLDIAAHILHLGMGEFWMAHKPHFLVTAGSTREKIDRVREWGNIFTGKTGLDIALALLDVGGVTLLTASNTAHAAAYDGYYGKVGMLGVETLCTTHTRN